MKKYKIARCGDGYLLGMLKANGIGYDVVDNGSSCDEDEHYLFLTKDDTTQVIYLIENNALQKLAENVDEHAYEAEYLFYTRGLEYFVVLEGKEVALGGFCFSGGLFVSGEEGNYILSFINNESCVEQRQYVNVEETKDQIVLAEKANGLFDIFEIADDDDFSPISNGFEVSLLEEYRFMSIGIKDEEDDKHIKLFMKADEGYKQIYDGHTELEKCVNAFLAKDELGLMVLTYFDENGEAQILASGDEEDFEFEDDYVSSAEESWLINDDNLLMLKEEGE